MSQTDKVMELVKCLREKAAGIPADKQGWPWGDWICKDAADHIEAMQRDCRTCEHARFDSDAFDYLKCRKNDCTNHDKYQPMLEFKQLTKE